ncbi:M24 family metallopeptidase [Marivita geojedonensis]|uniref:Peptidase M24 n=1 Tax=Marivita geojedonensis TaxID=1123756 RepID=A0A1X4NHZ9_9RHOB|nr:M24 family metallopeptidase [Marivita geojedonensis]OSQ47561.1 peptidase M24 [Marivita geojedonensis]PRY74548.1 Xaa-Pro aminopeptidase [Marivita geojedonensis]
MTRMERLQSRMAATGTDLVALAPGAHLRWLLGFAPHPDERACLLLIGPDKAGFVMPALNAGDARQHTDLPFWDWRDDDGPDAALAAALQVVNPSPRAISVDETMRADHALLLLDAAPQARRSFAADTLGALRMVKDARELAALEDNARIADRAQTALRAAIRPGISERELADVAKASFEAEGARMAFGIVGAGAHSSYPHHHTGGAQVTPGDAIVVDIGATKDGYFSDITRMACLGACPAGYQEVHAVVEAAVVAALAVIRPGVEACAVDKAARDVITDAGFGAYFTHRTGHGLGSEVHEPPYMTAANPLRLEEGMVFTVEPGIYLPDRFGVRLEEVAVVTSDGCRILSELSRDVHVA